jgi:hypothetical protein
MAERVELSQWQRAELEAARVFVAELERMSDVGLGRMAYWLGRLDGHVRNLIDLLDVVAAPAASGPNVTPLFPAGAARPRGEQS